MREGKKQVGRSLKGPTVLRPEAPDSICLHRKLQYWEDGYDGAKAGGLSDG